MQSASGRVFLKVQKEVGNICGTEPQKHKAEWREYLRAYREAHGRPPAYLTETMGCQMNERDSETISGLLCEMGCVPA
ncbi:MAG: hypothetical protein LBD95_01665, partial [Clostridiales Family XIII bacterium]|nr:hypothetical protein [Clostridiales Family XIII bacterium]